MIGGQPEFWRPAGSLSLGGNPCSHVHLKARHQSAGVSSLNLAKAAQKELAETRAQMILTTLRLSIK
jgi:hypothetical protein